MITSKSRCYHNDCREAQEDLERYREEIEKTRFEVQKVEDFVIITGVFISYFQRVSLYVIMYFCDQGEYIQ